MTRRALPEWIGKTPDTPAPPRVKLRIIDRQDGKCACGCGVKLGVAGEGIEFDHRPALVNGGENRESKIEALRSPCHAPRTKADVAEKSRVDRKRKAHLGFKAPKRGFRGWRRFDGTLVWKE